MFTAFTSGYLTSLSLILAIGAQNAFVLRQGLRREHVALVVAVCGLSDAALIVVGVGGFGLALPTVPWLEQGLLWAGSAFLFVYGALRLKSAWQGGEALVPTERNATTWLQALMTCVIFTWANPHVYIDTVMLLGSLSTRYTPFETTFGIGAALGSLSFFSALGYGARFLAPIFAKPKSWVILEIVIGLTMWGIALSLLVAP
ncbi:MAG: LysE/ArgO family amino acid transporter [Alphaproteobacteria bacterium]